MCRSKEEAIAPELKKGVKMSVHHSRDTAHKQWSETRVIALRGLSRVLRTCTRLLLQESWFRVIWVDALNVCQGALQAACDEQEVSIAALDVVFTMLRIIIQTDCATPGGAVDAVTPAEKAPAAGKSGASSSSVPPAAPPSLSKDEVENIEKCKLALWQLTWTAVRTTAFFTCNSVELALAISQKLKELYKSRMDHEFRYSDNVRVLLEILVALVRPRVGILRGAVTSASAGTAALPDLITQKQDRVAESQLQRAVIDLLCVIQPADGLAQSCLMSTLTEICFSVLWVQVPVAPQSEAAELKAAVPAAADAEWLILGAAPERLRKEAGEHLGRLLVLQFSSEESTSESSVVVAPVSGNKLFPWASASAPFISLMIDIVVRRFVVDICEGPLVARCSAAVVTVPAGSSTGSGSSAAPGSSIKVPTGDVTSAPSSGFFSAFGSIMSSFSSPTAQNLQPVYAKHSPGGAGGADGQSAPAIASARIAGGTLHKFVKYIPAGAAECKALLPDCTPVALSLLTAQEVEVQAQAEVVEWRTFYLVDTELKLLLASVQACYSLMSNPYVDINSASKGAQHSSSNVEVMSEAVWNSLLTATACLLSPWRASELCSKSSLGPSLSSASAATSFASGAAKVVIVSDPGAGPSTDIASILKVSLKIIDFMR